MSFCTERKHRLPEWFKIRIQSGNVYSGVVAALNGNRLNTVCENALCPNRSECYNRGTATVMILGNVCTRQCAFCAVQHGVPAALDVGEPQRVLNLAKALKLKYVVVTSVTRDDLADGGASIFAETIRLLKTNNFLVEVLTPDFKGDVCAVEKVLKEEPDVFNHNIETVKRLQIAVRPQADYCRSLQVLKSAASRIYEWRLNTLVKSGIMVGLGESDDELFEALQDLYNAGCRIITMGQYLAPSKMHLPVARFVEPDHFERYKKMALKIGFKEAFCGPLVRSSYRAEEIFCGSRKDERRNNSGS
jgi:lipoic acid synthetase